MTKVKAFKVIVISLVLIVVFDYVIYKCYFDQNVFALLGIFVILYSSLELGAATSRLFVKASFSFSTLTKKESYNELKQKLGRKIHLINIISFSIVILTLGISAKTIYDAANNYKYEQLQKFGQYQKVKVNRTGYLKGSYIGFDLKHLGRVYERKLSTDNDYDGYKIGDSITIKFSIEDPSIIAGPKSNYR